MKAVLIPPCANSRCLLFVGLFPEWPNFTAKYRCIAKIRTRKSLLALSTSVSIVSGDASGPDRRPIGGTYRGDTGSDDRDRTFLGGKAADSSPSCLAVTRPPEMAAFVIIVAGGTAV
jgi:hypothetical protein